MQFIILIKREKNIDDFFLYFFQFYKTNELKNVLKYWRGTHGIGSECVSMCSASETCNLFPPIRGWKLYIKKKLLNQCKNKN